jgi:hypothetical protein
LPQGLYLRRIRALSESSTERKPALHPASLWLQIDVDRRTFLQCTWDTASGSATIGTSLLSKLPRGKATLEMAACNYDFRQRGQWAIQTGVCVAVPAPRGAITVR